MIEDGKPLEVSRISGYDPFSMISDGCQRFEKTGHNNAGNPTMNSHLFLAIAKHATSPLTINVTDEYGNVHTRIMERPKQFSISEYTPNKEMSSLVDTEIDEAGVKTEFFDLTGMRISNPGKGLYVMKKGTTTSKILIK